MKKNILMRCSAMVFCCLASAGRASEITVIPNPAPPALSIPQGGPRLEFCSMALTSSQPAVAETIIITQSGTAPAAALAGVLVVDEFGRKIGDMGFLGASLETTIHLNLLLRPGRIHPITVVGEFTRDVLPWQNLTLSLGVREITGSIPVSGPFPIAGTAHQIDAAITVGSLDVLPAPIAGMTASIGAENQPLGQFSMVVTGEEILMGGLEFEIYAFTGLPLGEKSVVLVDETGNLLAGPVDAEDTLDPFVNTLTFHELVSFPTGSHVVRVSGTLEGETFPGDAVAVVALPQAWHVVRGKTYGYELSRPRNSVVSGQVQIQSPSLTVRFDTNSPPLTVVSGARQVELARYTLDARVSSSSLDELPILFVTNVVMANDFVNGKLYDGNAVAGVWAGSVYSAALGGYIAKYAFTPPLLVRTNVVKVLSLRGDIVAPSGMFELGLTDRGINVSGISAVSGLPIPTHFVPALGPPTTIIGSGKLAILPPIPQRRAQIGVTNTAIVEFAVRATNEAALGSGARIDIPVSLAPSSNSSPAFLGNISMLRLATGGGAEFSPATSIAAIPPGNRTNGAISFFCNSNCRFENGIATTLRIKGTIGATFGTGDRLTFDMDGMRFSGFRGETSLAAIRADGQGSATVVLQGTAAEIDSVEVTPAMLPGQDDLVELGVFAAEGLFYHVDASTNLVEWQRVTPFPLRNGSGYIRYFFEVPPNQPQRFYRAVTIP